MGYRPLGSTGIMVSEISFGAGPVPALMTDAEAVPRQVETVRRALELGLNWFDTAATYGDGQSERHLGKALRELGATDDVVLATKVRVPPEQVSRMPEYIRESLGGSLERLGRERLDLFQLHNTVTEERGSQTTSLTVDDVLGRGGVVESLEKLREEGLVTHLGFSAMGEATALREVLKAGVFATAQVPWNLLEARPTGNGLRTRIAGPVAHNAAPATSPEAASTEEERVGLEEFVAAGVAVLAIRVLAGGALAGRPPSEHTKKTPYFPLSQYEADQAQAAELAAQLPEGLTIREAAIRYVVGLPEVTTAVIGFSTPEEVEQVCAFAERGPLPKEVLGVIREAG